MTTATNEDQDFGVPAASGGGQGTSFKELFHEIPQGTSLWQIAPGMKSLKQTGKWCQFWAMHWGYRTIRAKDEKEVPRPFVCVLKKNFTTNKVDQACPECDLIQKFKNALEAEQVRLKGLGKSKEEITIATKPLSEKIGMKGHKYDMKYYCLARNAATGKWAVLRMGSKLRKQIQAKIDEAAKGTERRNLLDPNSCVFWEIERTGEGFGTEYKASLAKEWSAVSQGPQTKASALTTADREALRALPDLTEINQRSVLTVEQVTALVASGGDPTVATKIFGAGQKVQEQDEGDSEGSADDSGSSRAAAAPSNPAPVVPTGPANIAPGMSQRDVLLASGIDASVLDQFFSNAK